MIDIPKEQLSAYLSHNNIPEQIGIRMLPFFQLKFLKKNEILVRPNEICSNGYLVISGGLILSHFNQYNNEEKVVGFFLPSTQPFCTAWDSYFSGKKTQCKLFSFTDTIVATINKNDFERKIATDSEIMNFYLLKLNETLVLENNLRIKLLTCTSNQFYQYLLSEHPQIIKKIPTKYIAEFMGISREWLSKIKSNKSFK